MRRRYALLTPPEANKASSPVTEPVGSSQIAPHIGVLHPSETATIPVTVDTSDQAIFTLGWDDQMTTTLSLTLIDPSGNPVTPANLQPGMIAGPQSGGYMY